MEFFLFLENLLFHWTTFAFAAETLYAPSTTTARPVSALESLSVKSSSGERNLFGPKGVGNDPSNAATSKERLWMDRNKGGLISYCLSFFFSLFPLKMP